MTTLTDTSIRRKDRPIDIKGIRNFINHNDLDRKHSEIFNKNFLNRYFPLSNIKFDKSFKNNYKVESFNLFKVDLYDSKGASYFFSFEMLSFLNILLKAHNSSKILTTENGVKEATFQQHLNHEKRLIKEIKNAEGSYGNLRLQSSSIYLDALLKHATLFPFLNKVETIINIFTEKSFEINHTKLYYLLNDEINSYIFKTLLFDIDTWINKSHHSFQQDFNTQNVHSLDEYLIKQIMFENSSTIYEFNNLPKDFFEHFDYHNVNHLNELGDNIELTDESRVTFYNKLKEKNCDLKTVLEELFSTFTYTWLLGANSIEFFNIVLKDKSDDSLKASSFVNEHETFLNSKNPPYSDDFIKELLIKIDDFYVNYYTDKKLIQSSTNEYNQIYKQNDDLIQLIHLLENDNLTKSKNEELSNLLERSLSAEIEKKEKELAALKKTLKNIESTDELARSKYISKFHEKNKLQKLADLDNTDNIISIQDNLYEILNNLNSNLK